MGHGSHHKTHPLIVLFFSVGEGSFRNYFGIRRFDDIYLSCVSPLKVSNISKDQLVTRNTLSPSLSVFLEFGEPFNRTTSLFHFKDIHYIFIVLLFTVHRQLTPK